MSDLPTIRLYAPGVRVRLAEFDNGEEVIPAECATVLSCEDLREAWGVAGEAGISYVVRMDAPSEPGDDRLRELTGDQIEGVLQ